MSENDFNSNSELQMTDRAAAFPPIHLKICSRADVGMLNKINLHLSNRKFTSETSHSSGPFLSAVDRVFHFVGKRIRLIYI